MWSCFVLRKGRGGGGRGLERNRGGGNGPREGDMGGGKGGIGWEKEEMRYIE